MMDALEDKWTIQRWVSTVSVRMDKSRDGAVWFLWHCLGKGKWWLSDAEGSAHQRYRNGLGVLPGFSTMYLSQRNRSESIVTK